MQNSTDLFGGIMKKMKVTLMLDKLSIFGLTTVVHAGLIYKHDDHFAKYSDATNQ